MLTLPRVSRSFVREHHAPVGALRPFGAAPRSLPSKSGSTTHLLGALRLPHSRRSLSLCTCQGAPRTCRCIETSSTTAQGPCRGPVREHHAPGMLFRGGFEGVGREGCGGGLLGRVLLVRRVVAKAFECVSPLRLDGASRMVGRRLACRDAPRLASTSLNPRDRTPTREIVT